MYKILITTTFDGGGGTTEIVSFDDHAIAANAVFLINKHSQFRYTQLAIALFK